MRRAQWLRDGFGAQWLRDGFGAVAAMLAMAFSADVVWAQLATPPPPAPLTPAAPPASGAAGSGSGVLLVGVLIGLFIIIGVAVKLYDRKRKRDEEAMYLQARIADALLLDPSLASLPVAATVKTPFMRRSPVIIEVTGQLPSPGLREAALKIVKAEASRSGVDFEIEDHIAVAPHVRAA
jgi:hypothetical protein